MRAGMLAYLAALAVMELCSGVVVAEAWRQQSTLASVSAADMQVLSDMLFRLRVVEAVVAAGAVITTVLWSFIAVRNASAAGRNGRSGASAVVAWALAPVLVLALGHVKADDRPGVSLAALVAQAAVIALPFSAIAWASRRVGGAMAPFMRWFVALTLAFLVHEAFTGSFNLSDPKPADDLGRAAAIYLATALVVGVMVVMAGEAAHSMEQATNARLNLYQCLRADTAARFPTVVTAEHRALVAAMHAADPMGTAPPHTIATSATPVMSGVSAGAAAGAATTVLPVTAAT
ncbi:MAG: hypothetical protein Q7V88_05280 [Actinomycetota bacterium]|nr:hypothetical protein [Actinomycetota bacterium]